MPTRRTAFIRPHPRRRGVAMLLVLISLMMATVLTASYLASRDNSTVIGQNAASVASARWVADAGLQLSLAVLQTESDWRESLSGGKLFENLSLAGGKTTVEVIDLETGGPPGPETTNVKLTSSGIVSGLRQQAVATAFVPTQETPPADVDLSEFAVFVKKRLEMRNRSTITRWGKAPLGRSGRIAIGTQATSSGSITLMDSAATIDGTVFSGPSASSSLVSTATSRLDLVTLLDNVPFPAAPGANVAAPSGAGGAADLTMDGGATVVAADERRGTIQLKNNAVRTLRGDVTLVADEDLTIDSGAKLLIDGKVRIVVFGNLSLNDAAIELMPGSKLAIFVRGDGYETAVDIMDGYIGDQRADNTRDASGNADWMNPERVMLYSMPPAGSAVNWLVQKNSVIKGSLYVPNIDTLSVQNESAIYGRVAATQVGMNDDAAIFYDPGLNSRSGYTNPDSPLYDASSRILSPVVNGLTSLDTSTLQAVATNAGIELEGVDGVIKPITSVVSGALALLAPPPPSGPTPRPIHIDYQIVSIGNAVREWEQ